MSVTDADELSHPPGQELSWAEWWSLELHDEASGLAGVVRLRPGVLVEQELTFQRAGEHLLYCTVYCGIAHDRMQGKIVVTEGRAGS